jgi:antitoxin component YwqK of YwqJK toxin-antitoxin module
VIERYTLKNSQVWGRHERFYDNGQLALVSEEEASRRLNETEFFDDGQKKRVSVFNGRAEVKHDEWYQNGQPKLQWTKTLGGDRETFTKFKEFYDNGKVREEGTRRGTVFYDGLGDYEGEIKIYLDTGELASIEHYQNKRKNGLQKSFTQDENKQPIEIDELYENGVLQKVTTIDAKTKKPRRIQEFMPDGSTKSDKKF